MARNWHLFRRSLARHPGLMMGLLWPLIVLAAIYSRPDAAELPLPRVLLVAGLVGALPWIPIIWTAWTGRNQYKEPTA